MIINKDLLVYIIFGFYLIIRLILQHLPVYFENFFN